MYCGRDFSPADVVESDVYGFNFVNDLQQGELLTGITSFLITVAPESPGTDPLVASRLIGAAALAIPPGETTVIGIIQRIATLQPNVIYTVQAVVTTSLANTKSLFSHIFGEAVE